MPNYTPELVESVLHQYLHTDTPVGQIAAEHGVSERDLTRMRQANGVPARGARVRALPPAMRRLLETTRELKAAAPPHDEPPAPSAAVSATAGAPFSDASVIERIERLIERELAAEEATRAALGSLARTPTEAERCARTVASMTRSLHTLMRLRAGLAPEQGSSNDHGIPADIDEFRRELARRIEAFVASQPDDECNDGDRAAVVAVPER